ncbi:hypothetical protein MPER_09351, partial [Moniliophthora perniciosa FA553]
MADSSSTSQDWEGRYYHIDQILDVPGPRTDEGFMAGDGVKNFLRNEAKILVIGAGGLGYQGCGQPKLLSRRIIMSASPCEVH